MPWVVDTCVIIDVLEDDPDFGALSARTMDLRLPEGLVVCPVTYAELAPAFDGCRDLQDEFLSAAGVDWRIAWSFRDTLEAHTAWNRYVQHRRRQGTPKRPLADILIGAFASGQDGLITRNPADFAGFFPDLPLIDPTRC